ncbi:hypothetical protein [Clostridium sp.]|uniref:hypothetical protein n=1 Tax=Clostridium sp. TaxID=1506 RepID=UPI003D6D3702
MDKGYTVSIEEVIEKMFNCEFISRSIEKFPEVTNLLENYESILPLNYFNYYGVNKNGN